MKTNFYKVGDRVLVKDFWGSTFHAYILYVKKGWFGYKYYCKWGVNSDYAGHYEKGGMLRDWNIICKN